MFKNFVGIHVVKNNLWWLCALLLLSSCSQPDKPQANLIVAVASNMQIPMQEIVTLFESEYGIAVNISSGSSGVLAAQITQGAPFDIFLSSHMKYARHLYDIALTDEDPRVFAYGSLILWSLEQLDLSSGLASLRAPEIERFAIANPETAPYGIAAMQALEASSLLTELEQKMVIGESVSQVNQYVSSRTVDSGITSSSALFSLNLPSKGVSHEIDRKLYEPIEQVITILKMGRQNNPSASELFQNFMFSPKIQTLLSNYGYLPLSDHK